MGMIRMRAAGTYVIHILIFAFLIMRGKQGSGYSCQIELNENMHEVLCSVKGKWYSWFSSKEWIYSGGGLEDSQDCFLKGEKWKGNHNTGRTAVLKNSPYTHTHIKLHWSNWK